MFDFIERLLGNKQIKCVVCGQLKWVKKDHKWIKPCYDCRARIDAKQEILKALMARYDNEKTASEY